MCAMNRLCFFGLLFTTVISACQQGDDTPESTVTEHSGSNEEAADRMEERADSIARVESYTDSLENLADKVRDRGTKETKPPVTVTLSSWWTADKNLNTIRKITLTNNTGLTISGVKLVYVMPVGKSFDNRNIGKFKVNIKPLGKVDLKVPARKFGVSDDIIDTPNMLIGAFPDSVAVSLIYYSNGNTESNYVPIGFQPHK